MNRARRLLLASAAVLAFASALSASAQAPAPPAPLIAGPPDWSGYRAHADKAKALAGSLWPEAAAYFCGSGQRVNDARDPAIAPQMLFDELGVIGSTSTVVYVLKTPDGGVTLIDSGLAEMTESVILPGLRALGVDPAQVKTVLIAHGHADHFGGAAWFQARGAHVAAAEKDWDAIAAPPRTGAAIRRDLVLEDGKPLMVGGGVEITPYAIPGHTPGSLGFVFPVHDGGKAHKAGLFGGTILRSDRIPVPVIEEHLNSIVYWGRVTAAAGVDVEVQNHPLFDRMWERAAQLKARKPGEANPFVVGRDGYRGFVGTMGECYRAVLARKGVKVG